MGYGSFFHGDGFALHGEDGQSDLLVESSLAAASGVQPEPAVDLLFRIFVRMTENHHVDAGEVFGHKLFVVNHENRRV